MAISQQLQTQALDLGFDVAGWASARVSSEAIARYQLWLDAQRYAGMEYLPKQFPRRQDLSSSLPEVQSVLVLGVSHAFAAPPKPSHGVRIGRVARYAWTPDYHQQLEPYLQPLLATAQQLGVRARAYIDHGPIMERELAGRAFLGWQGKSGMNISTKLGAFVTLAVILTNLPFQDPQLPLGIVSHPDRCGRCNRCVQSCPTEAIGPDRMLYAERCLAYLTIEHRGPIPLALRASMADWLFGCDICSEVCPWTEKAGEVARLWKPQPELVYPDLQVFFGLSNRQFERKYAHTAFARARRKGLARNACIVLGNQQDVQYLPLLMQASQDEAWEVREAAAWALGQIPSRSSTLLLNRLSKDAQIEVRQTAVFYSS